MADGRPRSDDDLSPFDYLMFRNEDNPQFRSTILNIYMLDRTPDWDRLRRMHERTSRLFLRMRQHVVVPTGPLGTPRWVVDPDFDLSYHLRRVRAPAPGTDRQLLDLTEPLIMSPLDRARPLWEATLVEELEGGGAALIHKFNHAVVDGLGGVKLMSVMFDTEPDAPIPDMPPMPVPADISPEDLTRATMRRLPQSTAGLVRDAAAQALRVGSRTMRTPRKTADDALRFAESLRRVVGPLPAAPSPLLRRRSLSRRLEVIEVSLAGLRAAAKAAGVSVNDAYLAAIGGALRRYHDELGVPVDAVPGAVPISLRRDDDPIGGNQWAGARIPIPTRPADPAVRMQRIRELMLTARAEPAINAMSLLAPVLSRTPTAVLHALSSLSTGTDVQASNVPGPPTRLFLAGAEVVKQYPFGPLPGPAMMVTMFSHREKCWIGVNYDRASVTEDALFKRSLQEGFDEVIALWGATPGRANACDDGSARPAPPGRRFPPGSQPGGRVTTTTDPASEAAPRVPGTVGEIDASPAGSRTGAFFDFDGTLVSGFSASVFANDRVRRREVGAGEILRLVRFGVEAGLGVAAFADLMRISAESMKGRTEDELLELSERLFVQKISDRVFPEAKELVEAHQRRGHTVVLLSSATRYQIAPVARELGVEHIVCNELEVDEGVLTGGIRAPIVWGETKAHVAQQFAAEHGVDVARSYFYADGDEDVAFMYLVGQPRPTNPRSGLEKVARKRGWPVLRFSPRGSVGALGRMRNLAGVAALAPAAIGGTVVGVVARDRRAGVNFLLKRWIDTLFVVTGVKLRVGGEEHLWSHRPAVFIFNHRNNFDVFMVGRVVERDFTSIGKKELASNPLSAGLGKLIDAVFIDRADSAGAIAAMAPVQEAVQKGLSLIVSPEGTRSSGRGVGPFKKGPFRIAMAAGVPLVPIVLRNADDVAPRNATMMRPGTVDMVVLAPIPIEDWTTDNLNDKIAAVRQQYIDTLAAWPGAS